MEINPLNMNTKNTSYAKNSNFCQVNYNNALKQDTVSFSGKNKDADLGKKKSGFLHKALISSTGCFIPGMGQALNGQWGKALMFGIGVPAATVGAFCVNPLLAVGIALVGEAAMFIDAYRNA